MRANRSTLVKLCLLTALAVPVQRAASASVQIRDADLAQAGNGLLAQANLAQTDEPNEAEPQFTLPQSLEGSETLTIDGSSSMRFMNEALSQRFQAQYPNAEIESETNGTDAALERLSKGEIDLAAIGRPLTAAEKQAGLRAVPIAREKIAIIVGPDNPFSGNITFDQFGKIFRGEITNWSQVGGESGPIRFVDRPESSDTRQAFRPYPVFQAAPFETGATAEAVSADETEAVIEALGADGIGYAIANQVMGNDAAKIVSMHKTLPDNPAYPFSQPRSYVYRGEASPAVQGFLAVATSPEGEEVIAEVRETEGAAAAQLEGAAATATSPDGQLIARTNEDNVAIIEDVAGKLVAGPLAGAGGAVTALAFSEDGQTLATGTNTGKVRYWGIDGEPKGEAFTAVPDGSAVTELAFEGSDQLSVASQGRRGLWGLNGLPFGETTGETGSATSPADSGAAAKGFPWWLLLIPLLGVGLWLLSRRRSTAVPEPMRQTAPTATVPPPESDPDGGAVSNRAQSVISTDRVTDESRVVSPELDLRPFAPADPETSATLPEYESTDLESPDLEGTNLDLITPAALGGAAALGGMAIAGIDTTGLDSDLDADVEADEAWNDNLDLTLDDTPEEEIVPAPAAPPLAPETVAFETVDSPDFWDSELESPEAFPAEIPEDKPVFSDLETLEPTRDTVIAETETILDIEPTRETIIGDSAVIFGGAAAASLAAGAAGLNRPAAELDGDDIDTSTSTEKPIFPADAAAGDGPSAAASLSTGAATYIPLEDAPLPSMDQFEEPLEESSEASSSFTVEELAAVDDGLSDLPDGYGDSRIVLLPRDPKWAYAYWDVSNEHKEEMRIQGGQRLMLRLYDVTDIDQSHQAPHSMQQQECHEMARSWYLEVPVSDRDYSAEIGYLTADDRWLMLARSASIRVPPIYPSDWIKDQFVTIGWEEGLAGRTFGNLGRPDALADGTAAVGDPAIYQAMMALSQEQAALRMAGSLFGSMQQTLPGALWPSGMVSGFNVSGLNMSGIGSGASVMPGRSRKFWLVADAELIVYGATEPDATLTVGDRVIPLNPDGTFRFHVAFPDGQIDYPIRAVAVDGEQSRSISLHFERETPERHTNTKAEAEEEWF
jgi:ABC-type phosphate transport system substrate-binding protein